MHCALCGTPARDPRAMLDVDSDHLVAVLRSYCLPDGAHRAALQHALDAELALNTPTGRIPKLCPYCHSWKRRILAAAADIHVQRAMLYRTRHLALHEPGARRYKEHTPLDALILFTLAPGTVPPPARKHIPHIADSIADNSNAFSQIVPIEVRATIREANALATTPLAPNHITRAWWSMNGHTDVFTNPHTATLVRRLAHQDADDTPDEPCE